MARTGARGRCQALLLAALALCATCACVPAAHAGALRASAISAAPEPSQYPLLQPRHGGRHASAPSALSPSLSLSPDIMPLLPSPGPGDDALAPSDVAATIPSSPSPPNPDALEPDSAFAPFGSAAPAAVSGMQSSAPPAPRVAWAALPAVGLVAAMWLA
ncbi:classical arabinogalactan protein 25-like [Triticum urartu]|uniref:classical arabinogalactan protein 25-like n=1 Tax=Triticum urartu TaxID=4572 RepID=UPI002043F936|nr:classical arabinogalactan protein 25-like [Triticum urartu]